MIVVDTNVICQYFLRGDSDDVIIGVMRKDPEWVAPYLWMSEARNVLTKLHVHKGEDLTMLSGRLDVAELFMRPRTIRVKSEHVLPIAMESGLTAYDAEFVSVAMELDCPLLTLDRKIRTAYPMRAIDPVVWLGHP
jgi:predicted nucleic acid-binding protein